MRLPIQIAVASIAIALAGCASTYETYTPDGRKALALNCSGTARGWDKCLKAAGDNCGDKGYDIIERTSEDLSSSGGSTSGFYGVQTQERSMLIACKESN
jgi:hypothetical protein